MVPIRLPHRVVYDTPEPVPISDIIDALRGAEIILMETAPLLEEFIPGLKVERISVSIQEISQRSPFKEIFWASAFLTFQKDLEREVPKLVEDLFRIPVSDDYDTIVTLVFCLIVYYGAKFAYHQINRLIGDSRLQRQFNLLVADVAQICGKSEEEIKAALDRRYQRGHIKSLVSSCLRFFKPSKNQHNASVTVGGIYIDSETVAEVPSDAQMLEFDEPPTSRHLNNVEIELHAQDIDRRKRGWAAVIPSISKVRMPMELYPPLQPEQIYTKTHIRGDVLVVFKAKGGGIAEPKMCHLIRIIDDT